MLAPRKNLWSTPLQAVDTWYNFTPIDGSDTVVDLGCGDGRVLVRWAELYWQHHNFYQEQHHNGHSDNNTLETATPGGKGDDYPTFVGIDIDSSRIEQAQANWLEAVTGNRIPNYQPVRFHCANVLERMELWMETVTVLYVYLTPRGLRQLRPLLLGGSSITPGTTPRLRLVVSYMNPLPNAQLIRRELVRVPQLPDAAWPVFMYKV